MIEYSHTKLKTIKFQITEGMEEREEKINEWLNELAEEGIIADIQNIFAVTAGSQHQQVLSFITYREIFSKNI